MLSIIIPIYNSDKYLAKCINSIRNQTYQDWELILVDDGSTDNSINICEKYAKIDNRLYVIHKENGGVSSARNRGMECASGQYITFVDSDDWVLPQLYEKLMRLSDSTDLVIGGMHVIRPNYEQDLTAGDEVFDISNIGEHFDKLFSECLINAPVAKIYKKKIIDNLKFPNGVAIGEDLIWNLQYIKKCKTIALSSSVDYIYNCLNENSATRKFRAEDIDQNIRLYQISKDFQKKYCSNSVQKSFVIEERLCANGIGMIQLICYSKISNKDKKRLINKILDKNDFIRCCQMKFEFPLKYSIPQKMCRRKNYYALRAFFYGKLLIKNIIPS